MRQGFFFPEFFPHRIIILYMFIIPRRTNLLGMQFACLVQRAPNPSKLAPTCTRRPERPKQMCRNSHTEKRSEQEQAHTNSQPLVEDTPAEDLPAAGGADWGRFGDR